MFLDVKFADTKPCFSQEERTLQLTLKIGTEYDENKINELKQYLKKKLGPCYASSNKV